MKLEIDIKNTTKQPVDLGLIESVAKKTIEDEIGDMGGRAFELSVAVVSSAKIRSINKKFRGNDCATDVLSFTQDDFLGRLCKNSLLEREFLGEILICCQQIAKDAKEQGISARREMEWVVVHGVLHLLGYDHEVGVGEAQKMRQKEFYYLGRQSF